MDHPTFIPCAACGRHTKALEAACPFCGVARTTAAAPRAWPAKRLARAAVFTFGLAAAGCSEAHTPDDDADVIDDAGSIEEDAGRDAGNVFPPYGTPPDDAAVAPLYGGAPED